MHDTSMSGAERVQALQELGPKPTSEEDETGVKALIWSMRFRNIFAPRR